MAVHLLRNNPYYVLIRCHRTEADDVVSSLREHGFDCGAVRDVGDIPQLVDINIKQNGKFENIDTDSLREMLQDKGFDVK